MSRAYAWYREHYNAERTWLDLLTLVFNHPADPRG